MTLTQRVPDMCNEYSELMYGTTRGEKMWRWNGLPEFRHFSAYADRQQLQRRTSVSRNAALKCSHTAAAAANGGTIRAPRQGASMTIRGVRAPTHCRDKAPRGRSTTPKGCGGGGKHYAKPSRRKERAAALGLRGVQ